MKKRISFTVDGANIVGNLYTPSDPDKTEFPTLLVAGPMTSVKEQVTGVYAKRLSQLGYATLTIDHRHFGESEGQPRQYENYKHKIEDLHAALDWLKAQHFVDQDNLSVVGICLGTGYLAHTVSSRDDIKAICGIAGYYRDIKEMRAMDPEAFDAKVEQGRLARIKYEEQGELDIIPAVAMSGDAAMPLASTYDYYSRRAKHANYKNEFAIMSREYFLKFDVVKIAEQLTLPFFMLHGPNALNPSWADKFYQKLRGIKKYQQLDGNNQTDYYYNKSIIDTACDYISDFLNRV